MKLFNSISDLTQIIVDLCIEIHIKLGPGCFERVYEEILYYELTKLGIKVERQVILPLQYKDLYIKDAYKIDLLVENRLLLELKSVHPLPAVFFKQVRTQLSLLDIKYGMLINFKENKMVDGIHRVYNNKGKEQLLDPPLTSFSPLIS